MFRAVQILSTQLGHTLLQVYATFADDERLMLEHLKHSCVLLIGAHAGNFVEHVLKPAPLDEALSFEKADKWLDRFPLWRRDGTEDEKAERTKTIETAPRVPMR